MSKFMKLLNNISRSQAIYRTERVSAKELSSCHFAYVLSVCREPGRNQDQLARDLCVNKSTVARNLTYLEEKGFITREAMPNDKRQFSVYPTDKMLSVLPEVKKASKTWMDTLSEGIDDTELEIFNSVLCRMEQKARELTGGAEDIK